MNKKIIASVAIAAALFAGSVVVAAPADAAVTVSAARKAAVAKAVKVALKEGYAAILITGYNKVGKTTRAVIDYADKYVAKKAADLAVRHVAGHAEDGLTIIAASDDTTSHFEVNGVTVHDGDVVKLPAGTTAVKTLVNSVSDYATSAVDGDKDLVVGDNILTFTVTAEDGNEDIYSVDLQVAG